MSTKPGGTTTAGYVPPDVVRHDSQRVQQPVRRVADWAYDAKSDHLQWATSPRDILGSRWPIEWANLDDEQIGRRLLAPVLTAIQTITDTPVDAHHRIPCVNGERIVHLVAEPSPDLPGRWTGYARDATEEAVDESTMQELLVRYQMLTDLSPDCIVVHQNGKVVYANQAALRFAGVTSMDLVLGRSIFDFIPTPSDVDQTVANITSMTRVGESRHHGEIIIKSATGEQFIMDSISMFTIWDGYPAHQVIMRDITATKKAQEQLEWQANHDPLTGLWNRTRLAQEVQHALESGSRGDVGLLYLSLDRFGLINDNFGYESGDLVLKQLANRLRSVARRGDSVARLGGDSFVVLCPHILPNDLNKVANRLVTAIQEPISIAPDRSVSLSCSVGVAHCSRGTQNSDWLLRGADMAVRSAKRRGGGTVCLYDEQMHKRSMTQLEIASDLREAIEQRHLQAYFQPITDCMTGVVLGQEALIRWHHPRHGMIQPSEFISVAEETGLITDLGRFMIEQACQQIAHWHSLPGRLDTAYVSVNLSVKQLEDTGLVAWIDQCLAKYGLRPEALVMEVTESMMMQDLHRAIDQLQAIRNLGVRIAMDDFGTGYSSLYYLQNLPLDIIKIDKAFVDRVVTTGGGSSAIVAGVLGIARSLRLTTCAEGVETDQQLMVLRSLGCDAFQGYLTTKPLPPQQLDQWFEEHYQN
jgi:diguanylate cyclase (GGDEF)-like protein/PAS domain S-box-containing protein